MQASVQCNTFGITGHAEEKSLEEMLPGILNQLGADSIANLRRFAESFKAAGSAGLPTGAATAEDDDIPELVENFDAKVTV